MDLKPGNVLVDDQENAIVIDWEQCGASPFFLAPEANGMWDAEYSQGENGGLKLLYKKHFGPMEGQGRLPKRDVFRIWQQNCPRALEAAEVYSLGRTLWAILQQISEEVSDRNHLDHEPIVWSPLSVDIPTHWKLFISSCTIIDPNERPRFQEAVTFWEDELGLLK
ncbi:MAG: hypothetical protein M1820_010932, partial [Bogoriella megaspora]